ncbi:MAG: O-antigen ligase family protein [Chloroflexi bacterium]|nr:O-antigen ligase family protein [Chloroflexota bacterium]
MTPYTRTREAFTDWITGLNGRTLAAAAGLVIGLAAAGLALSLVIVGPLYTAAAVIGGLAALFVLTSIQAALYGIVAIMTLLPFGTMPFSIGFTPTLIDVMIAAFLLIYVLQWMIGQRNEFRTTPVHGLLAIYILWIVACFALGLRYAAPTSLILRQFAETLLILLLVFVLVDLLRDTAVLRRLVLVMIVCVGIQAVVAIVFYRLPDPTTERLLRALKRIGYPGSNIIRYIEQNPDLPERAIGTWVDPNTLGGALAIAATMIAPQVFARRPVLRFRGLTFAVLGSVTLALYLTYSRTSMLALGVGLAVIAFLRYRRFIPLMIMLTGMILLLPQAQDYLERFLDAFRGGDLATQMRLGEYSDAARLISQYPVFGIGFTGSPSIDLYSSVASMYLIMANQIGLVGVGLYGIVMFATLVYGYRAWRVARQTPELDAIHLGFHAALIAALVNGIGDLYYFRIDFQAAILLFWLTVSLALASSTIALRSVNNNSPR